MITDKLDMLKHEACQKEVLAIMGEFRQGLLRHFEIVDLKSRNLINERWGDK